MRKRHVPVMSVAVFSVGLLAAARIQAGSLAPTNAPGPTMHTLEEIYQKVQNLAPQTLRTIADTTTVVEAGCYAATNLVEVDADLAAANIKAGTSVFGVDGSVVEATGDAAEAQVLSGTTFSKAGEAGLTGTMTEQGARGFVPGVADVTIPAGYYSGAGVVTGDAALVTGNIRSGAIIFGVTGKTEVVDTAGATATDGDILSGKTAYADGVQRTGSIQTKTLADTTAMVQAGHYAATNLVDVDADLAAANIKTNVTIFGIAGTLSTNAGGSSYSAAVPKTGQTISYQTQDDGDLEKGVVWPNPRFVDNGDGTVTDNLTGLIWLKNANTFETRAWTTALTDCATLNSGEAGLTDGSVEGDWRLPNVREMQSLIDYGRYGPALPSGHPFTGVQSYVPYWSSSTDADVTGRAWCVNLDFGHVSNGYKSSAYYVWPVRAGQ